MREMYKQIIITWKMLMHVGRKTTITSAKMGMETMVVEGNIKCWQSLERVTLCMMLTFLLSHIFYILCNGYILLL